MNPSQLTKDSNPKPPPRAIKIRYNIIHYIIFSSSFQDTMLLIIQKILKFVLFILSCLLTPFLKLQYFRKRRRLPPIRDHLLLLSASEIARRIRKKEVSERWERIKNWKLKLGLLWTYFAIAGQKRGSCQGLRRQMQGREPDSERDSRCEIRRCDSGGAQGGWLFGADQEDGRGTGARSTLAGCPDDCQGESSC